MSPVTPGTRRSRVTRADRRREATAKLLQHAERLLQTESWTDLSIERLCSESGVPRSTFYLFFEDQGDLLSQLADTALDEITQAGDWWQLPRRGSRDDLIRSLEEIFAVYAKHGALLMAVVEAASYDERIRLQWDRLIERSFAAVTEHISRAQAEGWMDPDLDADHVAHWLGWMGESGLRDMVHRHRQPTRRMIEAFAEILWNTLYRYQEA